MTSVNPPVGDVASSPMARMADIGRRSEARIAEALARGPVKVEENPNRPASEDRKVDETTRGGLAIAETARDDIEVLTTMVAHYNSAKSVLDVPKEADPFRASNGDERADARLESARKTMESAKHQIEGMQQRMAQLYRVAGSLLSTDDQGDLSVGDFTLSQARSGWSMSVGSDGKASVHANGVDVSALVDNTKNNGDSWDSKGATVDTFA